MVQANQTNRAALLPFAFSLESTVAIVLSRRLFAALAYLTLFVSVCANWVWFRVLALSGTTAASSYHFTMPPLGMQFGGLLLGQYLELTDFAGIVPVALGIYLVSLEIVASPKNSTLKPMTRPIVGRIIPKDGLHFGNCWIDDRRKENTYDVYHPSAAEFMRT
jgi:hypothetical protein